MPYSSPDSLWGKNTNSIQDKDRLFLALADEFTGQYHFANTVSNVQIALTGLHVSPDQT